MNALPIDPLLPEVRRAVRERGALVLTAEPGAGKTTRVPAALLEDAKGDVVVLEPRRIAARLAARRVADERGEKLGETVGFQVRFEDVSGPRTRLRFVTEGILARRLQDDPSLRGTSVVVLDEFHERHLEGDLALALAERARRARGDLAIVVLSATLAAGPIAAFLDAPVIEAKGRTFPVEVEHAPFETPAPLEARVAEALGRLLAGGLDGDVLVFLPGAAEIRRAREACSDLARRHDLALLPLHGSLPPDEQDRALAPSSRRKVILSTNVAETSITIDGVCAVIDSGLARIAGHSPWSGLPTLEVEPVSRASAAQRAGRAGRTRPGRCLRLYTRRDHDARPAFTTPEIEREDLAGLALATSSAGDVRWLTPPPEKALDAARALLRRLGAIDARGPTDVGRRMLRFPLHPRLARVLVEAEARGVAEEAATVAAILGQREMPKLAARGDGPSDVLAALDRQEEDAAREVERARRQLARIARVRPTQLSREEAEKALLRSLLAGYPDRVARRRSGDTLVLVDGTPAKLARESVVRSADYLLALEARESAGTVLVRVASAIEPDWLIDAFPDEVKETADVAWDARLEKVEARSRLTYGAVVLDESARGDAPPEKVAEVLEKEALAAGAAAFAEPDALVSMSARASFVRTLDPEFPELDDAAARAALSALARSGFRSFRELREAGLIRAMLDALPREKRSLLDRLAPEEVKLASGRRLRIHYARGQPPWVESRLQDFFGLGQGPSVGGGRTPLVLHLLAPNQRPVQITTDLAGFWVKHYPAIRRELSRRYPKHAWPEEPRTASPPPPSTPRRKK